MKFNRGKSVNIVVAVHHMLGVSFTQVTFNQAVIFFLSHVFYWFIMKGVATKKKKLE